MEIFPVAVRKASTCSGTHGAVQVDDQRLLGTSWWCRFFRVASGDSPYANTGDSRSLTCVGVTT